MKNVHLFNEDYMIFSEFEVQNSKVSKIYTNKDEILLTDVVEEIYEFLTDISKSNMNNSCYQFGLIVPK